MEYAITNKGLIYPELSFKITGILFSVQNELGRSCNEKQYGDAVETKFKELGIQYEREKILPPSFAGEKERNKIDFLVEDKILLEFKCKRMITREDYYQTKRYLTAMNKRLALLVNFRDIHLKPKRILNS